ncbi:MAG: hypothetical protein ABSE79_13235 [Terriglobia bacterium]
MTTSGNRIFFFPLALLIVGLVVLYPVLHLPSLSQLFQPTPKAASEKTSVKIWANQRSGLYYCPGSKLYGKLTPGTYMSESEAIQNGYQPGANQACR